MGPRRLALTVFSASCVAAPGVCNPAASGPPFASESIQPTATAVSASVLPERFELQPELKKRYSPSSLSLFFPREADSSGRRQSEAPQR